LALINAPSDALCLELTIIQTTSTWGGKTQLFDITPGTSPTLTMNGLPSGSASLAARSFGVACAQVQASTSPTWITAGTVPVTLVAGQTVSTTVVLRRPGGVQVTATFDDGSGGLTITPSAKDFGAAQVTGVTAATLTVTNPGTTAVALPTPPAISGTDSTQFMTLLNGCGTSVAAGATCTIMVDFKPTTVGSKTATLTVANATASLTGTAVTGVLTITPNPANFPNTAVGTTSTFTVTLTNSSAFAFTLNGWTISSTSGEFGFGTGSTCGASLPASASCTQVVTFSPQVAGSTTGTLISAAGASSTLNASASSLTITPSAKDFGAAQVTGVTAATLTVTNSGTTAVALPTPPAISGTDSTQFMTLLNGCGTSVAAGATCTIMVDFKPTTVGSKTATLTVADATASLTGTAVTGALTITPNPANFPNTAVGTTSTFTVTLTNSSAFAFTLNGWTISSTSGEFGFGTGSTCGASLPASASCTQVVTFSPQVAGSTTGTLISAAGASSTLNASASSLTITPSAKDFGAAQVTGVTAATLTVTNSGTTAVALPTPPAISGTDSTQFMTLLNGCGTSVAAGATCTIMVDFKPTTVGSKTATLTVADATASLTGTAVTGDLTITPNPANFPNTAVGTTSTFTVTLTNSSAFAFALNGWTISSTSGEFGFGTGSTCGASLPASASCTQVVTFSPQVAGSTTGTLISASGASSTLNASTPQTAVYRIDCGSNIANSPFGADQYASGGTQNSVSNAITVSGVTNAAPQAVYQSERYGNSTYTLPSLTASAAYTVRLHFAEIYWTATGKRAFNVAINGATALSNFDIYAAAGGNYKAVVRDFATTANSSGQIVVNFTTVTDNASISGIEILH
jgi:hypothetical protein